MTPTEDLKSSLADAAGKANDAEDSERVFHLRLVMSVEALVIEVCERLDKIIERLGNRS